MGRDIENKIKELNLKLRNVFEEQVPKSICDSSSRTSGSRFL